MGSVQPTNTRLLIALRWRWLLRSVIKSGNQACILDSFVTVSSRCSRIMCLSLPAAC
jgi:hypothetical protein